MSKYLLGTLLTVNSAITVHQIQTHFVSIHRMDSD